MPTTCPWFCTLLYISVSVQYRHLLEEVYKTLQDVLVSYVTALPGTCLCGCQYPNSQRLLNFCWCFLCPSTELGVLSGLCLTLSHCLFQISMNSIQLGASLLNQWVNQVLSLPSAASYQYITFLWIYPYLNKQRSVSKKCLRFVATAAIKHFVTIHFFSTCSATLSLCLLARNS